MASKAATDGDMESWCGGARGRLIGRPGLGFLSRGCFFPCAGRLLSRNASFLGRTGISMEAEEVGRRGELLATGISLMTSFGTGLDL